MAIPGLSLPDPSTLMPLAPIVERVQRHQLASETEYRFEASFIAPLTIKLLSGNAELYGTELAPGVAYTFRGTKAAIYTWYGCEIEVTGVPEADYVAEDTTMMQIANVHFALEDLRNSAADAGRPGPRVMVVGPEDVGKTSIVKTLTAYSLKASRQPTVVNLDPTQGLLSMPGSLSATTITTLLDVEEGWGSSPISGPSALPVKTPLCYHYGCRSPQDNENLFRPLVNRLAMAIASRLSHETAPMTSGLLIDTPGSLGTGKQASNELIEQIVADLSVDILLVIGSERLYSEIKRRLARSRTTKVIKIDKSGGCVDRSDAYMKQVRHLQIRQYFYGHGALGLSPFTQFTEYDKLNVFRINDLSVHVSSFDPGDKGDNDDDDEYQPAVASSALHDSMAPSLMLQNTILAVTHANSTDGADSIRDASVMWYIYIADVDDCKRRMKVVSPISGRVPTKALLYGAWPEGVPDIVA